MTSVLGYTTWLVGFLGGTVLKNLLVNAGGTGNKGFNPWVRKIFWRRKWQPTPVLLPGRTHGGRSLGGYSWSGHKESDMTEWLNTAQHLKILQQYENFQMYNLDLEKAKELEIKLPTSAGSWKKQESSRKISISALLTMPKPLTVWITINCGKFWKRWEYQSTWPASWETYMQVRRQHLELDMEQWLVPNRKRSTSRLYIVTLLI